MTRIAIATVSILLALTIGSTLIPGSASAEQGIMIYGFVLDRTGLPVANATVTLLLDNVPLPTGSNPAIADVHGYYEFIGIQRGTYCLLAEKNAFSSSATMYLQTGIRIMNFTLQGSATDLADVHMPEATPSPVAVPEIATATPAQPVTTPGTTSAPGFAAVVALSGILATGLMKRPRR